MSSALIRIVTVFFFLCPYLVGAQENIKVGVTLALSGAVAEYGEAVRNGIRLAQTEHPDLFQHIEFLFEDDQYNSTRAVSNFRKFRSVDNIDILFSFGAEPSLALAPLAEAHQLPFITQSLVPAVSKNRKYVIRFIHNGEKHGAVLTNYFQKKGVKRIGMIQADLSVFEVWANSIKDKLHEGQEYHSIATVLPSETDFRTILLKVKQHVQNFDTVGVYLLPFQLKIFYKQAQQLGLKLNTFGSTPFESSTVLQDVLPLLEGVPFTHAAHTEQFAQSYIKSFGNNMHVGYAAGCYDFAVLLGRLMKEKKILPGSNADTIIAAFKGETEFDGASGKRRLIDSPEDGTYFDGEVAVKMWVDGKVKTVYSEL